MWSGVAAPRESRTTSWISRPSVCSAAALIVYRPTTGPKGHREVGNRLVAVERVGPGARCCRHLHLLLALPAGSSPRMARHRYSSKEDLEQTVIPLQEWNCKQLRVLQAVGETGSFSAAADLLDYTQPAVSKIVAGLEQQVGTTLVDRGTRPLRLTEAGSALARRAGASSSSSPSPSSSSTRSPISRRQPPGRDVLERRRCDGRRRIAGVPRKKPRGRRLGRGNRHAVCGRTRAPRRRARPRRLRSTIPRRPRWRQRGPRSRASARRPVRSRPAARAPARARNARSSSATCAGELAAARFGWTARASR